MLPLTCSVILDHFCSLPCLIYPNEFCHFLPSFTLSFVSKKQIITYPKKALLEDYDCEIKWNCIFIRVTLTHIQTGLLILECNTIYDKNCKRPEAQNDLKLIFSRNSAFWCLFVTSVKWNHTPCQGKLHPLLPSPLCVIAPRSQKMQRADNEPTKTKGDKDTRTREAQVRATERWVDKACVSFWALYPWKHGFEGQLRHCTAPRLVPKHALLGCTTAIPHLLLYPRMLYVLLQSIVESSEVSWN